MSIIVYLGPTMPVAQAREILPEADFRPPAAQSDILSAVEQDSPAAIVLIDGVFTQSLSVWHKEILYALERGVAVYGSSSMGALRVAETAAYGAVGHGAIYQGYAAGELTDDDEVAVMHATAEHGFSCLSDAMVNIRATLAAAARAGVIGADDHDALVSLAKARFFPERTYAALFADATAAGLDADLLAGLREFVRSDGIDQKRLDAISLLGHLRDVGPVPPDPQPVTRSHPFLALYHRDRRVRRQGIDVPLSDVATYAALHVPGSAALNDNALHGGLLEVLGELLQVEPDEQARARELTRFRADRRLRSEEDVERWRLDNDLNDDEFADLIRRLAVRRALRDWYVSRKYLERTTQDVLDELRLTGQYPAVADAAARQQQVLASAHPDFEFQGDETDLVTLVKEHARETSWRPTVGIDVWAFENGFKDVSDVRYELVRARLARHATAAALGSLTATEAATFPLAKPPTGAAPAPDSPSAGAGRDAHDG